MGLLELNIVAGLAIVVALSASAAYFGETAEPGDAAALLAAIRIIKARGGGHGITAGELASILFPQRIRSRRDRSKVVALLAIVFSLLTHWWFLAVAFVIGKVVCFLTRQMAINLSFLYYCRVMYTDLVSRKENYEKTGDLVKRNAAQDLIAELRPILEEAETEDELVPPRIELMKNYGFPETI